ncbi:Protoheme IX farnesyltransferase, mitochondrial [Loxospora ochrophaea]|nr:Protoheme IX farnesyltransferase, mitochondrial [Loxospora ochrophaea]
MIPVSRRACSRPFHYGQLHLQRCLRLARRKGATFSSTSPTRTPTPPTSPRGVFRREYFSANGSFDSATAHSYLKPFNSAIPDEEVNGSTRNEAPSRSSVQVTEPPLRAPLPPQKPSNIRKSRPPDLSDPTVISQSASLRRLVTPYFTLAKPRLTFLMVLTTTTAYSLYPVSPLLLSTTTISPSLSPLTLLFLTTGTFLSSSSANALNMLFESRHDAKMPRTSTRPLVHGLLSKRSALLFAVATGTLGLSALYVGVNPTVAFLSALTIFLYAGIYTPLKRKSVLNTWVGAVVGGIPPLMGWVAAAGETATSTDSWRDLLFSESSLGGWLLSSLLFAWQFPHFNALSWSIREEYKNAGYRMLAWVNPHMNARVALRYSVAFIPICVGLSAVGVTDWGFVVSSSVVNAWIVREAWKFWRHEGKKGSARSLFWAGVWHLPVLLVLAMVHKQGVWEGVWRRVVGEEEEKDEDEWLEEDEEAPKPAASVLLDTTNKS